MTPQQFRKLALSLPEATEGAHMGHADFRVRGKIFATLSGSEEGLGMVKLPPEEQAAHIKAEPAVFEPSSGAWGRRGCTSVHLKAAKGATLRRAMFAAWRKAAPGDLVE